MNALNRRLTALRQAAEEEAAANIEAVDLVVRYNHLKVLEAFQANRIADYHFHGSSGYGYGNLGRDVLDQVYAAIFKAESALVRPQIVSGTHAIAACLFGVLRPGEELIGATGAPYDTLQKVIGYQVHASHSLVDLGVTYRQIELNSDGNPDLGTLSSSISDRTRVVLIQRSRGYRWQPGPLSLARIRDIVAVVKRANPHAVCVVDNCYGELVEEEEPVQVGADLVAGSLIKNPGGGLVSTGGYIAGKSAYVEMAATRLTAPGLGGAVGSWAGDYRLLFQGLFLAPHVVGEALKSAIWAAAYFKLCGLEVSPSPADPRADIIQAVRLDTPERLIAFCRGLQAGSPVDSHVLPEPSQVPGYDDQVIMAGGTFVQGSSIELSADGPLRSPYAAFIQGGLSQEYVKLGILNAVRYMAQTGQLDLPAGSL